MKESEIYLGAFKLLKNPQDWQKGDYGTFDGPKCILGACNTVEFGYPRVSPFEELHSDILIRSELTVSFNDDPTTTHEEVLMALEFFALEAESRGE